MSLFEKVMPREYDDWRGWHRVLYEVGRGPGRWVQYIRPGRKDRERAALKRVQAAVGSLVDTPLGAGLSLRQAAKLVPDLRSDIYIGLLSGAVRLEPTELDRLLNDPDSVRAEFPEMFEAMAGRSGG